MGVDYLGMEDLESRVKGQTLVYIYNTFFPGMIKEQEEITAGLDRFEQEMTFEFIPGVESFIADLRRNGVKMAVVTSSNDKKDGSCISCQNPKSKLCSTVFLRLKCSQLPNLHRIASCLA